MIIGPPERRCVSTTPCTIHLLIFCSLLNQALARDGFRCVVTGVFDWPSIKCNTELKRECLERLNAPAVDLTTSHIVNEPKTQGARTGWRGAMVNVVRPITRSSSRSAIRSHFLPSGVILLALCPPYGNLDLETSSRPFRQLVALTKSGIFFRCSTTSITGSNALICRS